MSARWTIPPLPVLALALGAAPLAAAPLAAAAAPPAAGAVASGPAAAPATPLCDRAGAAWTRLRTLPPQTWRYERAWTLSSEEVLFGAVGNVAALDSGRVAVSDPQLGNVLILAGDGVPLRILPARGEGPGRVTQLGQVAALPGEGLALVQAWPARIEVVRLDGTPLRTLKRDPAGQDAYTGILELQSAGGQLFGALCEVEAEGTREVSLLSLDVLGPDLVAARCFSAARILTEPREGVIDETAGWFPSAAWAPLGPDRILFCPCRERFRLCRIDLASGRADSWERDLAPVPRSEPERRLLKAGYRWTVDGREQPLEFRLFEARQMIERLIPLAAGGVIAVSAHIDQQLAGRGTARLALLDLEDGTAADVFVDVPYRHLQDRLFVLPDGGIVIATNGHGGRRDEGDLDDGAAPALQFWRRREVVR